MSVADVISEFNVVVGVEETWQMRLNVFLEKVEAKVWDVTRTLYDYDRRNHCCFVLRMFRESVKEFFVQARRHQGHTTLAYVKRFKVGEDTVSMSCINPGLSFRSPWGVFEFVYDHHYKLSGELCSQLGKSESERLDAPGAILVVNKLLCPECLNMLRPTEKAARARFFQVSPKLRVVLRNMLKAHTPAALDAAGVPPIVPLPLPRGPVRRRTKKPLLSQQQGGVNEYGLFVPMAAGAAPLQLEDGVEEVYVPPPAIPLVDLVEDNVEVL